MRAGRAAGAGQAKLLANWGNGFATDPAVLSHVTPRASDASSFFIATWNKPYVDQIVLAPHFYCPAVRTALIGSFALAIILVARREAVCTRETQKVISPHDDSLFY